MIPTRFFVTSGKALSTVSKLNAFDLALKNASIAQCNLVKVSSIIPSDCREVEVKTLPIGAITYVVMARMDGVEGTEIGAGIAWAYEKEGRYGIVAEAHGYMSEKEVINMLERRICEMAKTREIEIDKINHRVENLQVPKGNFGCTIAALVYL